MQEAPSVCDRNISPFHKRFDPVPFRNGKSGFDEEDEWADDYKEEEAEFNQYKNKNKKSRKRECTPQYSPPSLRSFNSGSNRNKSARNIDFDHCDSSRNGNLNHNDTDERNSKLRDIIIPKSEFNRLLNEVSSNSNSNSDAFDSYLDNAHSGRKEFQQNQELARLLEDPLSPSSANGKASSHEHCAKCMAKISISQFAKVQLKK